jgi:hypothetical protein
VRPEPADVLAKLPLARPLASASVLRPVALEFGRLVDDTGVGPGRFRSVGARAVAALFERVIEAALPVVVTKTP